MERQKQIRLFRILTAYFSCSKNRWKSTPRKLRPIFAAAAPATLLKSPNFWLAIPGPTEPRRSVTLPAYTALGRFSDHQNLCNSSNTARKHRKTGRRHPRSSRPLQCPGCNGYPDIVCRSSELHPAAKGCRGERHAQRLSRQRPWIQRCEKQVRWYVETRN